MSETSALRRRDMLAWALPPRRLWNSLVATPGWRCDVYGIDPHTAIVGHREHNNAQFPGDALHATPPVPRNDVARRPGAARPKAAAPLVLSGLPGPRATGGPGPATGVRDAHP